MKTVSKVRITMLIAILMTLTYASFAQPFKGNPENEMYCRFEKNDKILKGLNLTEEQKLKIEPMVLAFKKQRLEVGLEVQELQLALRKLEIADKPNQQEINKAIDELGKKKTELHKLRSKLQQDIRKELSDEQRITFDTRRDKKCLGKAGKGHRKMRESRK